MIHAVLRKRPPKPLGVVAERCDAGRIPVVRRRVSTLFFASSVLIWIAAIGLYIRSRFRADAITWVTPWHHCIFIESADGKFRLYDQSPWPGPSQCRWTSGIPFSDVDATFGTDTLLGPPVAWQGYGQPLRCRNWRNFGVEYGTGWLRESPRIDTRIRDWIWDTGSHWFTLEVRLRGIWAPVWVMPILSAIPCWLWFATAGRRRHCEYSRRRRGLCVRCGYDLRQTPSRCPECGAQVGNERPSAVTPI